MENQEMSQIIKLYYGVFVCRGQIYFLKKFCGYFYSNHNDSSYVSVLNAQDSEKPSSKLQYQTLITTMTIQEKPFSVEMPLSGLTLGAINSCYIHVHLLTCLLIFWRTGSSITGILFFCLGLTLINKLHCSDLHLLI